jgi:hypothetical protein
MNKIAQGPWFHHLALAVGEKVMTVKHETSS